MAEVITCQPDSVLNLPTMTGLLLLGAPSLPDKLEHRLSRPFDRNGFVAAEGAGMVLLESEASIRARGVTAYAELAGFGGSADAYRVTAPHPEDRGTAAAMRRALEDGRVAPNRVACINAHGTSTPLNDSIETAAMLTALPLCYGQPVKHSGHHALAFNLGLSGFHSATLVHAA